MGLSIRRRRNRSTRFSKRRVSKPKARRNDSSSPGCLVERYRDELKAEMPEVDAFIGTSQINDILDVCDPKDNTRTLPVVPLGNQSATYLYDESTPRVLATPSHYAFVKIAEGCDRPVRSVSFRRCAVISAAAVSVRSSPKRISLLKKA